MIPLTMVQAGELVTIRRMTGRDEVGQRMAELGFVADSDVVVVSRMAGSLVVQVRDSRVALDQGMARRIMVERRGKDEDIEGCQGGAERHCGTAVR